MALNWSFWNGIDINDTWSIAYEFRQKFHIDQRISIGILIGIFIISLFMIWWISRKRKGKK